jgi:hypothetical protein
MNLIADFTPVWKRVKTGTKNMREQAGYHEQ